MKREVTGKLGVFQSDLVSPFCVAKTWSNFGTIVPNGPLTRYVKLQVAHAPGMPGTFSPAADFK